MNFNATLIGQMITFAVFVWFCMKYIWPPLMAALDERNARIADGLAAAQRGPPRGPTVFRRTTAMSRSWPCPVAPRMPSCESMRWWTLRRTFPRVA